LTESFNPPAAPVEITLESSWAALRAAAGHTSDRGGPGAAGTFALGADGASLRAVEPGNPAAMLIRRDRAWLSARPLPEDLQAFFDLYAPACTASADSPVTIGHLGQSLDGYIATGSGDSNYVTGPANILHLHRMRALCDAVVVGAGTVAEDDPRLTTRLASGDNPVRVILDPRRRLPPERRVFRDGEAVSLLICSTELAASGPGRVGDAEVVGVPCPGGRIDIAVLLAMLRARNLNAVFVEGGGRTVSSFLEAGQLDRMQLAIAPLVMGHGRPGLRLPANERIAQCLRPAHRIFAMGADILFDCDLRARAVDDRPADLRRLP
jgi:riboflavin-specific deaminase-like protein